MLFECLEYGFFDSRTAQVASEDGSVLSDENNLWDSVETVEG